MRNITKMAAVCAMALTATMSGAQTTRTLTFQNSCSQTVWIGVNGGFTQNCGANNSCPAGQYCLTSRATPGCFWSLSPPSGSTFELAAGANLTVTLTGAAQGGVQWSGMVYGSTGCDSAGQNCQTGCVNGTCANGVGAGPWPLTLAEFTLQANGADTYDISIINGMNLPMQMAPTAGQTLAPVPPVQGAPYWCGSPGNPSDNVLQGCSWTFDATFGGNDNSPFLQMVTSGGASCTSNSDCTESGDVCGLAPGNTPLTQSCGQLVGWWSAGGVCGADSSFGAPFNCSQAVTNQGDQGDMYGCNAVGNPPSNASCYQPGATSTCCGCPNWTIDQELLPSGLCCQAFNSVWTSIAQPWAQFLKEACPTAYSFPFDDATSTFNCMTSGTSGTTNNTTNYTITYCP